MVGSRVDYLEYSWPKGSGPDSLAHDTGFLPGPSTARLVLGPCWHDLTFALCLGILVAPARPSPTISEAK